MIKTPLGQWINKDAIESIFVDTKSSSQPTQCIPDVFWCIKVRFKSHKEGFWNSGYILISDYYKTEAEAQKALDDFVEYLEEKK